MKKINKKTIISMMMMLLLMLTANFTLADATTNDVDASLEKILYERTENPEDWLNFIESQSNDVLGKWLPLMIKKLATNDETLAKDVVDVTYTTVTNGYDWGPAIDKVVLDMGMAVDSKTVSRENFKVKSIRTFKDLDFATFTFADAATDHEVTRDVINAYTSDATGNAITDGSYITLEFEVGPDLAESSPFNYNILSGRNEYVETSYEISVVPGSKIANLEEKQLTFMPTSIKDKTGDIQPYSDKFVHNQDFELNGVALKYATFTPDKKNDEKTPLLIWLHGAGEGGVDTTIAVLGNNVSNLIKEDTQAYFGENGAYVLVPQAPTMWMDYSGESVYNNTVVNSDSHSYYEEALMALIEGFVADHPEIDTDRIYIGGCSNGGYMTVKMVIDHPEYFAAAYPAAEAYSADWLTEERINAIKDFPMWLTHAQNDPTVKISEGEVVNFTNFVPKLDAKGNFIPLDDFSNALYNRLVAAGNKNVHYSLFDKVLDTSGKYLTADGKPYEYMGHWSWIYTLNNDCVMTIDGNEITLFQWLAGQSR